MAQSKHSGRTGPLLVQTGLVAAFLAWMVTQSAHAGGVVRCWGRNEYGQCNMPADLGACSSIAEGGWGHTIAVVGPPTLDTDGDGRPDSTDNCPAIVK
jgi:hypothetical protein